MGVYPAFDILVLSEAKSLLPADPLVANFRLREHSNAALVLEYRHHSRHHLVGILNFAVREVLFFKELLLSCFLNKSLLLSLKFHYYTLITFLLSGFWGFGVLEIFPFNQI